MKIVSKTRKHLFLSKGFTLIELLIVIAILGILATAVLSAINPVEQINRGRDTGTQSDAEQLLNAIQRFDASKGYLPWQTGASDSILGTGSGCSSSSCTGFTGIVGGGTPAYDPANSTSPTAPTFASGYASAWTVDGVAFDSTATVGGVGSSVLDVLGSGTGGEQELLNSFLQRITAPGYNTLYVFNDGATGASTYVCFVPQSSSFKQAALTRWNGGTSCGGSTCTTKGVPTDLTSQGTLLLGSGSDNKNALDCLP
ncbi:type II secretion system GspH family protein [Patescibacteria group bacterium]|nr:type II secretion system GspH family protein [Patescibacteria group bacterium]MCL5010320.1 type II secretion system GspH family protein [Patescibacteria group bacterium]